MSYSPRFQEALVYAAQVHTDHYRKQTRVPYVTHLLAVASLVGEHGGDEETVIAALLHDAPEDRGGLPRLDDIRRRFGDRVADVVAGCSDTFDDPKPPWRQRKEAYIERLSTADTAVLLVSAADKLHNARATLDDLHSYGPAIFERFSGKQEGTLWYYQALVSTYRAGQARVQSPGFDRLVENLDQTVRLMIRDTSPACPA